MTGPSEILSCWTPSNEGLIEQLLPIGEIGSAITTAARQMKLCMMPGVLIRNHLKLSTSRLQRHQEKHALGLEGGIQIPTLASGRHLIKHSEGGVIEITLRSHNSVHQDLESTVLASQSHYGKKDHK